MGIERNVVGAHAEGFNTGATGAAVLGEYSPRCRLGGPTALANLLAWRLDVAHVDPATTLFISGGNARYGPGLPVFLRTVSGHRDTGFTDCPGTALYNLLTGLAGDVSRLGLPKLYAPSATGTVPGPVRFAPPVGGSALGSRRLRRGRERCRLEHGAGANVDWTWDATSALPGIYSYAIRSAASVRAAFGPIGGVASTLGISGLAADPETVSPNADGSADLTTITYTLTDAANVTVTLKDATGADVAVVQPKSEARREHAIRPDPVAPADGIFRIELAAAATGGRQASASSSWRSRARSARSPRRARRSPRTATASPTGSGPVRADRCGRRPAPHPEGRQVDRDAVRRPARDRPADARMGRRQADRPPARR